MRTPFLCSLLLMSGLLMAAPVAHSAEFVSVKKVIAELEKKAESPAGSRAGKAGKKGKSPKQVSARQRQLLKILAEHLQKLKNQDARLNETLAGGSTALMIAAALGEQDAVHCLLHMGEDATIINDKGKSALDFAVGSKGKHTPLSLSIAVCANDVAAVRQAASQLKDKKDFTTALHWIARQNAVPDAEIAHVLLKAGADVHALEQLRQGEEAVWTPQPMMYLFWCMTPRHMNVYEALVAAGLNEQKALNSAELYGGEPPLVRSRYHATTLAWLLERGADPSVKDASGKSVGDYLMPELQTAQEDPGKAWMLKGELAASCWLLALATGQELQVTGEARAKALHAAVTAGAMGLVKKMQGKLKVAEAFLPPVFFQMNVDYVTPEGERESGGYYSGRAQLEKKLAGAKAAGLRGMNPLYHLLADIRSERSRKMLEYLHEHMPAESSVFNRSFASGNAQMPLLAAVAMDGFPGIPLLPGASAAPAEAVQWLLEHGADPHAKDAEGHTALDFATDEEKKKLLQEAMGK